LGDDFDEKIIKFLESPDLHTTIFEQLKESFDNKIQEKNGKINKDRKDHWEKIDDEIQTSQHERNRNVIIEILNQVKDFKVQISSI
jgi:hypothetical protein